MSHDTLMCEGSFATTTPKKNDNAGVAMYHGGVEGTDAFSLGTRPCIHRPLLSVCNQGSFQSM